MAESTTFTKMQSDPSSRVNVILADENKHLRSKLSRQLSRQKRRKMFPRVGKQLGSESWKVKELLHILSLFVNN